MMPTQMANKPEKVEDFLQEKETLSLSTCCPDGSPWCSTTPYLVVENRAYVYISTIAEHYPNLKNNGNVSIMMVEEVSKSMNPFILKRATFKGIAQEIPEIPEALWCLWQDRFDKDLLERLQSMGFRMFEIPLSSGRFVTGYGKAFDILWEEGSWQQDAVSLPEKK